MHSMDDDRATAEPAEDKERDRQASESGSGDDVNTPFSPHKDDDSALGDSDQHSTA
jgi:hypothetical protein